MWCSFQKFPTNLAKLSADAAAGSRANEGENEGGERLNIISHFLFIPLLVSESVFNKKG